MSIILVLKIMFTTYHNERIGNLANKDIRFGYSKRWINSI